MSLPPEIPPCEAARIEAIDFGLDVVKDVLGQLDLAGIKGPSCQSQAFRIVMTIGQTPALFGNKAMLVGFPGVPVGAGNLNFKPFFGRSEGAGPREYSG
jgi:hypothetical protein